VDERVRRAKFNADVVGEEAVQTVEHFAMVAPTLVLFGELRRPPHPRALGADAAPPAVPNDEMVKEFQVEEASRRRHLRRQTDILFRGFWVATRNVWD
jgi:hypothetical protein